MQSVLKKRVKKVILSVISVSMMVSTSLPVYALENETDTIWGSTPVTAYITKEFYSKKKNSIVVPRKYFDGVMEGHTIQEKALAAFWEASRQSCYLFGDSSVNIDYDSDGVTITRNPYFENKDELKMRDIVESKANEIISQIISDGMTDYQKAITIYNYVKNTSTYDWDAYNSVVGAGDCHERIDQWANAVCAYGTLVDGKSVCQGDAQAFNLLARKAGLTSLMATGVMRGGGNHAWNRVWANSQWYEVDCCMEQFCSSYDAYYGNTGVTYDGVAIMESSKDSFYGV